MLAGLASTDGAAPTAPAIELSPARTQWRLMLSTQVSAAASVANLLKVAAILEDWLKDKWSVLHDDPGFGLGSLERHDEHHNLRYEVTVTGLEAELMQRIDGNVWVTTVCAKTDAGRLVIDVQNGVFAHPRDRLHPSVPIFLRKVIEALEATDGDIPLACEGYVAEDDETYEQLLDDLTSEERQFPVVVLSPVVDEQYSVDLDWLAKTTFGGAHVVALTHEMAQRLRSLLGESLSVPRGGARLYLPGFYLNADQQSHPVFYMPREVREGTVQNHRSLGTLLRNAALSPEHRLVRSPVEMALAA